MTSYEDRISVQTPEGVTLDTVLAGLGSRLQAAVVDALIQGVLLLVLLVVALGSGSSTAAATVMAAGTFLVLFGYHVLFEVRWSGRTPGKRSAGIRVVRSGGGPVGFREVAVRNVLRLVDFLPVSYAVALVSVLVDRQNRRLGDIAAGTIVVRERLETVKGQAPVPRLADDDLAELGAWDVSLVTADEIATVRRFLERRSSLARGARARLADELAERLMAKVAGPRGHVDAEHFLVQVVAAKDSRAQASASADTTAGRSGPGGPDEPRGRFG